MTHTDTAAVRAGGYRWLQLLIGIICMVMIANLQYGWTFFVDPIKQKFGWDRALIQWAFTIFVLLETWLVPIEGWLVDKYGPRWVVVISGILCGFAWWMNSWASTLTEFYIAAAIAGVGAGGVYGTCVGNALKWFPDRRGLAAGLTAMGFGAGSALTVVPIANMIKTHGFQTTFLVFGIGQGVLIFLLAFLLREPRKGEVPPPQARMLQTRRDFTSGEMLKTPIFWIMYVMFVMVAAGGLMATAQLAPIAKDFKLGGASIGDLPVNILGLTLPALQFAAAIDRVLNGVTRPVFGWLSDRVGRENTMFVAFLLEAVGIWAWAEWGTTDPVLFVVLTGVVYFAWGEIYSLFPSTCGDTYGSKYAAANAGWLYTAKGTASLLVPASSFMSQAVGGWHAVFMIAAAMNLIAAIMAIAVLKPMRKSFLGQTAAVAEREAQMQRAGRASA